MLLHTLPMRLLPEQRLRLPRHARGPLGIANHQKIWALRLLKNPTRGDEFIVSPYHPDCWKDLWRLQIQFEDSPGRLLEVVDIFDRLGIRVLHQTSRLAYKTNFHFNYFMLDCRNYSSDIDGDVDNRGRELFGLHGLRALLLLEFLDRVRLTSGSEPRITIERNLAHLNMHESTSNNKHAPRIAAAPQSILVENRSIDLTPLHFDDGFADRLREDKAYAVLSTNTKSHLIYCSILQPADQFAAHVTIAFNEHPIGSANTVYREILAALMPRQPRNGLHDVVIFNIERSQLRQGLPVGLTDRATKDKSRPIDTSSWRQPFTLNLHVSARPAVRDTTVIEYIKDALGRDELISDLIFVEPSPFWDPAKNEMD